MPGGSKTCFLGEADEFGDGFGPHLLHDPAAMDFYSLKGGSPLSGYLLTQHALGYELKNFQFPRRQGPDAPFDF